MHLPARAALPAADWSILRANNIPIRYSYHADLPTCDHLPIQKGLFWTLLGCITSLQIGLLWFTLLSRSFNGCLHSARATLETILFQCANAGSLLQDLNRFVRRQRGAPFFFCSRLGKEGNTQSIQKSCTGPCRAKHLSLNISGSYMHSIQ